ncbi:MAG: restriction endonuclease subunit R, partial [Bacteroidales bacterium]
VHNVNLLTVIASESYDTFARAIQSEMAEVIADRPLKVTLALFENKIIQNYNGEEQTIDNDTAQLIFEGLIEDGYVKGGVLTDKFYEDKKSGNVRVAEIVGDCKESVVAILDTIYNPKTMEPENARSNNVELRLDKNKFERKEFQELWKRINIKTAYVVDFETDELVMKAVDKLNAHLHVSKIYYKVQSGTMNKIKSKESLTKGEAFKESDSRMVAVDISSSTSVKYDLIGKMVEETELTRNTIVKILTGITPSCFEQFKYNPEEFILKASKLINDEKATVIIQHISYNKLNETFGTDIFTEPTMKGKLGVNAMQAEKHLYDYLIFDSANTERPFAEKLESSSEVAVYVKLPRGFYINTPVGKYNPDWAIAFENGSVKSVYFVAETKGSMSTMDLRLVEDAKIHCAREHFKALSTERIKYDVVNTYDELMKLVAG